MSVHRCILFYAYYAYIINGILRFFNAQFAEIKGIAFVFEDSSNPFVTEGEILDLLKKLGAVITESHLVYTSGKHGSAYVNKDAIYPHTKEISKLCCVIAEHFKDSGIEAVAAPALGGIILSQWIAHHLSELTGREVLSVYAEKAEGDSFVIKRGYDKLLAGKKVLVAEDIVTTGGSIKKVIETVRGAGGQVIAAAALCNRGAITEKEIGAPLFSLFRVNLDSYEVSNCPLCASKTPINTDVGKGREFLAKRPV